MKTTFYYIFVIFVEIIIGHPLEITNEEGIDLKCNKTEFKKARDNYETCVDQKYNIHNETNGHDTEIKKKSLCQTLEQFINDCTADSLENCYSEEHIHAIIQQQQIVIR